MDSDYQSVYSALGQRAVSQLRKLKSIVSEVNSFKGI